MPDFLDAINHYPTPEQAFARARRQHQKDRAFLEGLDRRAAFSHAAQRSTNGGGSSPGTVTGYPIVYGQETVISGLFREIIAPGAAKRLLDVDDVRALFNHDKNLVLGRSSSGTLALNEDGHGVRVRIDLPDTPTAREVQELLRRGDISNGSFAFWPKTERWYPADRSGLPLVVVEELEHLYDVSVVTYPAYEGTAMGAGVIDARDDDRAMAGRIHLQELRQRHPGSLIPPRQVRERLGVGLKIRKHMFTLEAA